MSAFPVCCQQASAFTDCCQRSGEFSQESRQNKASHV